MMLRQVGQIRRPCGARASSSCRSSRVWAPGPSASSRASCVFLAVSGWLYLCSIARWHSASRVLKLYIFPGLKSGVESKSMSPFSCASETRLIDFLSLSGWFSLGVTIFSLFDFCFFFFLPSRSLALLSLIFALSKCGGLEKKSFKSPFLVFRR